MQGIALLHNLPSQAMSFVGREQEVAEISALLDQADCRLLSLIGPGGMGKTRLALEVAGRKLVDFPDGVFLVELQALVSADGIVSAIASALNFEFGGDDIALQEQLLDYLSDKALLLLMDNFEHVLQGAELVARILNTAPQVKILVTSREALKLRQEWLRPLGGMQFPENGEVVEIERYSALLLFIERAQQLRRNFAVQEELPHIVRICQLVGGMPLGIELATAWLKTLSCAEIAAEIQKNTDLLTAQMRDIPERHQSIRIVFDATWQMLTAEEQTVFMRLSVFRGRPTRQAIQSVTGTSLLALSALTDKALLTPSEDGRYQIHDLLRQYAYEKLVESDELAKIQDAHSTYYLRFTQERQADLEGHRQIEALDEITLDFENIRVAWNRGIEQMNYEGIGAAVEALCSYLHFRSRWKQDSIMVTQAQERFAPQKGETGHPVWAMVMARNYLNNPDPAAALEQALTIAREQDNRGEIGLCLHLLGHTYAHHDKRQEAIRYYEAGIPYFEEVGNEYHRAAAYGFAGISYRILGDYETSVEYNEKSLEIRRAIGDIDGQSFSSAELASILFVVGNLGEAEHYLRETLMLAQQIGRISTIAWAQWELGVYHDFGAKGDVQAARDSIEAARLGAEGYPKARSHHAPIALSQSIVESIEGNYETARLYGEEAFDLAEGDTRMPFHAWGLIMAACGQGDYDTVREHTTNLLRHAVQLRVVPFIFLGISFAPILAAYQDEDPRQASALLALVMTHRSSMSGWLSAWPLIDHLKHHLENELGTEAYQAAWERGTKLEWEYVATDLLAQYKDEPGANAGTAAIPAHVLEANVQLLEPMTERELEVLLKIADGLSNREIAEQMFVGVSTIKKHITHIYGKLQVESRTQALLRAQELKLL